MGSDEILGHVIKNRMKKEDTISEAELNRALALALNRLKTLNDTKTTDTEQIKFVNDLIKYGAKIEKVFAEHDGIPTFIGMQQVIINHELIDPKKSTPELRVQMMTKLNDINPTNAEKQLTTRFLKELIYNPLLASKSSKLNEPLVNLLKKNNAQTTVSDLKKMEYVHTLIHTMGYSQLCALANVKVGSSDSYRLHALGQVCELKEAKKNHSPDPNLSAKIKAWTNVRNETDDTKIIAAVDAAIKAENPISRFFAKSNVLPEELDKHYTAQKQEAKSKKLAGPVQNKPH